MRILSIRVDDETDAQLRSVCERNGWTQTEAVRAGIAALAEKQMRTPFQIAEAAGLIGCFSDPTISGRDHSRLVKEKLRQRHRAARTD